MMQSTNGGGDSQQQQQQQWMAAMQPYQMVMQPQMMPPQPFMPYAYHHHHQQAQMQGPMDGNAAAASAASEASSSEENKTVWIGDLHYWMDENYLHNCFSHTGEVLSIKVIRNKQTGHSEGYGFVEFHSHAAAEKVLQTYNGTVMPNTDQPFRLNWASFSMGDRRSDSGSDHSIFVGDLASDVTDTVLQETFASRFPSVRGAKVVMDANTGRSKGYGFVRFADDNEKMRAMTEMNGIYCSSRPMRIGAATPRKSSGFQQSYTQGRLATLEGNLIPSEPNGPSCRWNQRSLDLRFDAVIAFLPQYPTIIVGVSQKCFECLGHIGGFAYNGAAVAEGESTNTTIFVGGLIDPNTSEDDLRKAFSQYGDIVSVKIPVGKQCGFVQFANRNSAEEALQNLNGKAIGNQIVRLSWGRNPANKQSRDNSGNQWNNSYYGGQVYDGYGYAAPPQDPSMYAAAYGAYPMYGNQQQVS
ncbi:Polyadenylate-binding protein RBP47 [Acorus calamus]|uniref:Polyadenylate-binding protein RBP47 n=1 Tax=Acorus calamus TaxID=4465 RepID=A0AAV9E5N3_ACOCL|nr:Polyadenylate-binding protein RBP47 [Acorus calamus]